MKKLACKQEKKKQKIQIAKCIIIFKLNYLFYDNKYH